MDLSKMKLPPLYRRNGRDCYLDPIRKKLIFVTPEETVRQRVISYLLSELRVPDNMLVVEDHLSHYGIKSNDRADIVVLALDKKNELVPLVVYKDAVFDTNEKDSFRHANHGNSLKSRAFTTSPVIPAEL